VIAGPNGAGKSSAAPDLLKDAAGIATFVNADVIAQGLAAFRPEDVAIAAGRIMLRRIGELVEAGQDFAFETTLSGRSIERLLSRAKERGYRVHVCYIWLPSAGRLSAMGLATWRIYDGSGIGPPRIVVEATEGGLTIVHDPATWVEIVSGATEAE